MVVIVMITIADFIIAGFIVNVKAIVLANNTAPAIRNVVNITVVVNSGKLKGERMKPKNKLDELLVKSSKDPPIIVKTAHISNQGDLGGDRTFCLLHSNCNDCNCDNDLCEDDWCSHDCACENVCSCEDHCWCDAQCKRHHICTM